MAIKMRKKKPTKIKKIVKIIAPTTGSNRKKASSQSKKGKKVVEKNFNIPKKRYIEAIGRRKVATSRVRIYEGKGDFVVNNMLVGEYFVNIPEAHVLYNKPFDLTGTKGKFSVTVKVEGSGISSQLGAMVHGISRALVDFNPEFRGFLKEAGLLKRDDRMKETRKIGMGGKARRKRQSPKR